MPVILSDLLHKTHSAHPCSQATLITAIVSIVTLVTPIVIVVMTYSKYPLNSNISGHWLGTVTYFEQPHVAHTEQFLVFLQTDTKTLAVAQPTILQGLVSGDDALSPTFKVSVLDLLTIL